MIKQLLGKVWEMFPKSELQKMQLLPYCRAIVVDSEGNSVYTILGSEDNRKLVIQSFSSQICVIPRDAFSVKISIQE